MALTRSNRSWKVCPSWYEIFEIEPNGFHLDLGSFMDEHPSLLPTGSTDPSVRSFSIICFTSFLRLSLIVPGNLCVPAPIPFLLDPLFLLRARSIPLQNEPPRAPLRT